MMAVMLGVLLAATWAAADYKAEAAALGGAWVHDTITSAHTCEASQIAQVTLQHEPRFIVTDGPVVLSGELKHLVTQFIGTAAFRGHHPSAPAEPTHLLRFTKGTRVVEVFVSTEDGSFRVVRAGRIVSAL